MLRYTYIVCLVPNYKPYNIRSGFNFMFEFKMKFTDSFPSFPNIGIMADFFKVPTFRCTSLQTACI